MRSSGWEKGRGQVGGRREEVKWVEKKVMLSASPGRDKDNVVVGIDCGKCGVCPLQ